MNFWTRKIRAIISLLAPGIIISLLLITIPVCGQRLSLNFISPFRIKNLHSFEAGEVWSVGGYGNLVINSKKGRKSIDISAVDLSSLFFTDDKTALVVGNSGEILLTENKGKTWQKQISDTSSNLLSVFCVDKENCWIAGEKGVLLKGGTKKPWKQYILSPENLNDVFFTDKKNGYVVGTGNTIFKTADGGKSWENVFIPLQEEDVALEFEDSRPFWQTVFFQNAQRGCVAGIGLVSCTENGGVSWQTTKFDSGSFVGFILQNNEIHLISEYGTNFTSQDWGKRWSNGRSVFLSKF